MGRSVLSPFGGELEPDDRWYVGRVEECLGLRGGQRCYRVEYEDGENVVRLEQQVLDELVPGVPDGHTWNGSMTEGEKRVLLRRASRGLQVDLAQAKGGTKLSRNMGKTSNNSGTEERRRTTSAYGSTTESAGSWATRQDSGGNNDRWLLELIEMNENRESRKNMSKTSSRKVDRRGMTLSSVEAKRRQEKLQTERAERMEARTRKQEGENRKRVRRKVERMIAREQRENRRLQQHKRRQEVKEKASRRREQRKEKRWRPGDGAGEGRKQHKERRTSCGDDEENNENEEADDSHDEDDDDDEEEDGNGVEEEEDEDEDDDGGNDDDNDDDDEDEQKHKVSNSLGEVE